MTPDETAAKLVEAAFELIAGDNAYKARVVAQVLDNLIGNDPHAVVASIKGLPAEMVELMSDALIDAIEKGVLAKLNA